ncbi:MAG: DUF29 domain-containing protein [Geminicoccaceae bacterium]
MATRIKPTPEGLYQKDFYVWTRHQADLLRAGRFSDLDLEHLIEEVEDLGESLYRSARSRIRTIIEHLLKLEHSPAQDPRAAWRSTVLTQRDDLRDDLTPTLRGRAAKALPELFEQVRKRADVSLRDHGEPAAADALPDSCPYTLDQITGDWLP